MRPIAVAFAALALTVACEPIADPDPQDSGAVVAVQFGDSLSFTSWNETTDLYVGDPVWKVSLNHDLGTQFDSQKWVNRYPSVPAGSTVILALGTNDVAYDTALAETVAAARSAIATVSDAGAVRVVVPTVNETSAGLHGGAARLERTHDWNTWLWRAENSLHEDYRVLDVVDWATASSGRTDWLGPDQLHHNPAGEAAYAQFLYDARLPG
jgi:hypothetical protein